MNKLLNRRTVLAVGSILACLALSPTFAATTAVDARALPTPDENTASCQAVHWNTQLLTTYPWAVAACQEVVMLNGEKWARFEADFKGMNPDGSFNAMFVDRQNRQQQSIALMPNPGQMVLLDDREYAFSSLRNDQRLNFYVPEGMYGFTVTPGAPPAQLVKVVEQPAPVVAPVRMAQADRRPVAVLPATAGPLPLLALGGLFSLLGGLGLTLRRRFGG